MVPSLIREWILPGRHCSACHPEKSHRRLSSLTEQYQNLTVIFSSFSTNEIVKKPRVSIKLKIKPKHSNLFSKSLLTKKHRIFLSNFGDTCHAWFSEIPVCTRNWSLGEKEVLKRAKTLRLPGNHLPVLIYSIPLKISMRSQTWSTRYQTFVTNPWKQSEGIMLHGEHSGDLSFAIVLK